MKHLKYDVWFYKYQVERWRRNVNDMFGEVGGYFDDWLSDENGVWWLNLDGIVDGDDYYEMLCYMNF